MNVRGLSEWLGSLYWSTPPFLMDMVFFDWSGVFYDCRSIFEMSLMCDVGSPIIYHSNC
jgi:hypothetical protein